MILKPKWNENRQLILEDRYLYEDEKNYNDIIERICKTVNINNLKESLTDFKFVPAGRMLAGIGTDTTKTFFNCYVLGFRNIDNKGIDSRAAISDLMKRVFEISARGGGIGINWSVLRPSNEVVKGVNGKSTGGISFLKSLDSLVQNVSQGGSRRGAMMAGLEPWHPDIKKFITIKDNLDVVNTANLSVFVSDKFMKAVKNNDDWDLIFPDTSWNKYDELWDGDIWNWLDNNYPIKIYDTVKAKEIYNLIAKYSHENGEPGMVFLERYNKWNMANKKEKIICTNPCLIGNTKVYTNKGKITLEECINNYVLKGKNIKILSYNKETNNNDFKEIIWGDKTKENSKIIELEIKLDNGIIKKIQCTTDHEIYTRNRGKVKAKFLTNKDDIITSHFENINELKEMLDGQT